MSGLRIINPKFEIKELTGITWYLKKEDGTRIKIHEEDTKNWGKYTIKGEEEDPEQYGEITIKGKMEEIEPEPSDGT